MKIIDLTKGEPTHFLLERTCMHCDNTTEFSLSRKQYNEYIVERKYVQDVFPELSKEEREVIISGTHPECWNAMFQYDEEDEIDYSNFSDEELGFDNEEDGDKMICICCNKELELLWKDLLPEATNIDNGADIIISGGYGSRYDITTVTGFICDDCIDNLVKKNIVKIKEER